jgi:hypothetical protein
MRFAQIIEYTTRHFDEIMELETEWRARTDGIRPKSVAFVGADRDRPDTYLVVVQWDSYEEAQRNNDLPATHEFATKAAALCDDPPIFRNVYLVNERDS